MSISVNKLIEKKRKCYEKIQKLEERKILCVDNQFKFEDEIFECIDKRERKKLENKLNKAIDLDFEIAEKIWDLKEEWETLKRAINYQIKKGKENEN